MEERANLLWQATVGLADFSRDPEEDTHIPLLPLPYAVIPMAGLGTTGAVSLSHHASPVARQIGEDAVVALGNENCAAHIDREKSTDKEKEPVVEATREN
ncbi:hypothetical protein KM043_003143 [Ampulex compressa]|nr:hypothetical protein KM043_003143 [Ampulex compressa]